MATSDQPLTVAGLVTLVQALDVAGGSQLTHALRDALNELPHESSHIPDPIVPDLAANGSGLHALPSTSTAISSQAHAVPAPMGNVTAHVLSRILAAAGPRAHPAPAPVGNVVTQGLWVPNMTPTTTNVNPTPLATVGPQAHPAPAPAGNVVTQGPWMPNMTPTTTNVNPTPPAVGYITTGPLTQDLPSGFRCQHCGRYNILNDQPNKAWYAITVGRSTGVFQGWHNVSPLVGGLRGFCCKRYPGKAEADEAYDCAVAAGLTRIINF